MSLARRSSPAGTDALVVATLNVRNTADRWSERAPLLISQLATLDPQVIGLQEVRHFPGQARRIAREADGEPAYDVRAAYKTGCKRLWEGIAVLSRLPVAGRARLALGGEARVAQRVTLSVPGVGSLDVYNTHLADGDQNLRAAQAARLLAWMDERREVPQVLVGDMNSRPGSAPLLVLTGRLRSAYALVHGSEPPRTVPSGAVLDYVLVSEQVTVLDAWVTFDVASAEDPELLPSDHFGVAASLSLAPRG
jgi:endonuclease/exonuclease/phosphatase family metal-dependent hydrolase